MSLFDGYEVYQEISSVLKIYPDFVRLINNVEPQQVRRFDYDPYNPNQEKKKRKIKTIEELSEEYEESSRNRARGKIVDIALCNPFDMFVTFTFDAKTGNRYDVDECKRRMAYWLNNQRILHGKFSYIIVAEYHKDGALHFHALLSGYEGNIVDSGIREKGKIIYNIASWRAGFTKAEYLDNKEKAAKYISKYFTKEMPKFKNRQRYWCSNGLKRPLRILNPVLTEADKALFETVFTDKQKEILEFRGQFSDNDLARIAVYGNPREDDLRVYGRD